VAKHGILGDVADVHCSIFHPHIHALYRAVGVLAGHGHSSEQVSTRNLNTRLRYYKTQRCLPVGICEELKMSV